MRALYMIGLLAIALPAVSTLAQSSNYRDENWQQVCRASLDNTIERPALTQPIPQEKCEPHGLW